MKLGKYKGLKVKMPDTSVTEADVMNDLLKRQKANKYVQNIDDRPVQDGDEAVISFTIECPSKRLPNSDVTNYPIAIGAHRFAPGFDEQIIGHSIGDTFDIIVDFPDDYKNSALAGLKAVYHTTLTGIRIPYLPPLDDDFALDYSNYDTLEALKAAIRNRLAEIREDNAGQKLNLMLVDMIADASEIDEDEEIIDSMTDEYYDDFVFDIENRGITIDQYCAKTGTTEDDLWLKKRADAVLEFNRQSVLHAVAQKESLSADEGLLADYLEGLAEENFMDPDEFYESLDEEELAAIVDDLAMSAAMKFIVEHAIIEK